MEKDLKPFEFTDEHESKLLEMCEILFPGKVIDSSIYDSTIITIWEKKSIVNEIHWFEFCWTILNKLVEVCDFSPIYIGKYIHLFGMVCFNQSEINHPIDYLYEEFKKWK